MSIEEVQKRLAEACDAGDMLKVEAVHPELFAAIVTILIYKEE